MLTLHISLLALYITHVHGAIIIIVNFGLFIFLIRFKSYYNKIFFVRYTLNNCDLLIKNKNKYDTNYHKKKKKKKASLRYN